MKALNRNSRILLGAAMLLALGGLSFSARAAVSCTVSSASLSFGPYDAVAGSAVTSSAALSVSCSGGGHTGLPVTFALSAGSNSSGSFNPRLMWNGVNPVTSNALTYNLYINTTYTAVNIFGDGTSGTHTVGGTTGNTNPSATATATVNGQIDPSQDPTGACPAMPCGYNDSVTITVTF